MAQARAWTIGSAVLVSTLFFVPACSSSTSADIASCSDGTKDGDEVGVDCGGTSCTTMCTGAACTRDDECASKDCDGGSCAAPASKPCGVGTSVSTCENGQGCELDKDCASAFCDGARCAVPSVESHTDGKKNAGETGVDCGGSVKATQPCPDGQGCDTSADCVGTCDAGTCGPIGPTDGKKNGTETDVDCGGAAAPRCENGKACEADTDCQDGYCPADRKTCVMPRNDDGVKNGSETDVDCGGASGIKCAETKSCLVDSDCSGACSYANKCVDTPSCKPRHGGDTCGAGEVGSGTEAHESCCKSLPVPGYVDPAAPGKAVYLDKYEITAGRVRAFVEDVSAKSGGKPDIRGWVTAHTPPIWDAAWNAFLPSDRESDTLTVPHNPSNNTEPPPWNRNAGLDYQFNAQLFVYVHGHNCINSAGSYGFPTFWLPPDVMTKNGGLPRANAFDGNGTMFLAKDYLDVKSATCITNAMLAAFCHWDGGQLATDEVLDFVTNGVGTGNSASCGTRCAPMTEINATSDSGSPTPLRYNFPYFADGTTHEGTARIAAPGRMTGDVVRINPGDEPWMDLHGNTEEAVLDMTGATFTGKFGLKYRGIGYNSARAIGNPTALTYPEYKAGYTSARCMRFK